MTKKIKWILGAILCLYIIICIVCNISYEKIVKHIINEEQLLYHTYQNGEKRYDGQLFAYLEGDNIVFAMVSDVSIAPFGLANIPMIKFKCTYNSKNPTDSIGVADGKSYSLSELDEKGVIIESHSVTGEQDATPHIEKFYLGYYTNDFVPDGVETLTVKYQLENGYFFVFEQDNNPNYDGSADMCFK